MRLLTKNLNQTIVYWATPSPDGWGGQSFSSPIEINGRWEGRQELFIDAEGEEIRSLAVIYVSQDVDIGGYLFLGSLTDLDSSQNPETQSGAHQIKAYAKVPDLKADHSVRKVWV